MQVVIFCGGKGTRIRDVSEVIPKPMLPIGGKPILSHIMDTYAHFGYKDFILCLGYKGEVIKNYFLNRGDVLVTPEKIEFLDKRDFNITMVETGEAAHTGERLKIASKYITGKRFMLTYGDGVGNIDIDKLLAFHKSHGKPLTITGVHPPGRFGELSVSENDVTFKEKPQTEGLINGGFFVIEKEFLDYLDGNPLENEPLQRCAEDGEMKVYIHDGYWQPMDTMREYNMLNDLWESGERPWRQ